MIGSACARTLLAENIEVIGFDDLSGGYQDHVPEDAVQFSAKMSMLDTERLDRFFALYKPTHVIHCAAFASENLSHWNPAFTLQTNIVGSANMISASVRHKVGLFVFTSSIAAYGDQEPPYYEGTPLLPKDPYGWSKACTEGHLVQMCPPHLLDLQSCSLSSPQRNRGQPEHHRFDTQCGEHLHSSGTRKQAADHFW